jgi:hypothetical protein
MASAIRFLHVANGTSTTAIIHEAGIPGSTSIWADPLHDGPVPGGVPDEQLLQIRARYLGDGSEEAVEQAIAELMAWRAAIDDISSYDHLVFWFEHDLFDQLNLIQALARIRKTVATTRPVSLICIGSFPGRPGFKGLGELTPDELASLFDTRQPVRDAQYGLAERAWRAFRASDPREMERLLGTDTSDLPYLGASLTRHLEEFPSTVEGLSRTEHRLLQLAQAGPIDLREAFPHMHDDETAFYIGDQSFWNLVQSLASSSRPLIAVSVQSVATHQLPKGTVALTDTGRAALEGKVDRVRECGIDRWLGGVHLTGAGRVWRWDAAHCRLVNA